MPKVKEIRKIESSVKEIKKEKVESLDDEFDDGDFEIDMPFQNNVVGRLGKSPTLNTSEVPQDNASRVRKVAKEDEQEISFRPSYAGGESPYKSKSYTPVGSAEGSNARQTKVLGQEKSLEQERQLRQSSNKDIDEQRGGDMDGGRTYVGEQEQQKRDKRRNL